MAVRSKSARWPSANSESPGGSGEVIAAFSTRGGGMSKAGQLAHDCRLHPPVSHGSANHLGGRSGGPAIVVEAENGGARAGHARETEALGRSQACERLPDERLERQGGRLEIVA